MNLIKKHPADHCSDQQDVFSPNVSIRMLPELKSIIVYSASPDIDKVRSCFQYAIDAGIEIQIPDNMLQSRNRLLGGDLNGID